MSHGPWKQEVPQVYRIIRERRRDCMTRDESLLQLLSCGRFGDWAMSLVEVSEFCSRRNLRWKSLTYTILHRAAV